MSADLGSSIHHSPARRPGRDAIHGHFVTLVPLDPAIHADDLWNGVRQHDDLWLYLFEGPFPERAGFDMYLAQKAASNDQLFFAIVERASGRAVGYASFMRIEPVHGVIEVGSILYTPGLQRTAAATEAMYLMARHVFEELGYRRYEWKCNAKNEPSRQAAVRLGFTFEGIFRQHMVVKGRNRDTAWYSMLDSEWPARKAAFERWLDPGNFDVQGKQRKALERGTGVEPVSEAQPASKSSSEIIVAR
jgi:RimJ/RimL family protein N-acetyltransferase